MAALGADMAAPRNPHTVSIICIWQFYKSAFFDIKET